MTLSIIIPAKNEEKNIALIYKKIKDVLDLDYEIIFIDDGSNDDTFKEMKKIYQKDKNTKVISFSRNFGKEAAMYVGLERAQGKYTTIIDCDLQQNPKYLLDMLNFLNDNSDYDQVAMLISKRKKNFFLSLLSKLFYKIINYLSDMKFVDGASDFRMFRSEVKDSVLSLAERNRFSKGIFSWVGFNTKYMEYNVEDRINGKSKFNFKNSLKLALDGIIGYSTKPLRVATILGIIISMIAIIYSVYIFIKTLIIGVDVPGYASLICIILFLGGIQLITIGILGEYISRTYIETKKRPLYIVKVDLK